MKAGAKSAVLPIESLRAGPIRHAKLPESFLVRIKLINHIFSDVLPQSLDRAVNAFISHINPLEEIVCWERMAAAYLDATKGKRLPKEKRRDILRALLGWSIGSINKDTPHRFEHLTDTEVVHVGELYRDAAPKIKISTAETA